MEVPIYVGLSRQVALRRQIEVVANNIANLNTVGFRGERTLFEAALSKGGDRSGSETAFTIDRATYTDYSAGSIETTGNPFDVALDGDGWLRVQTAGGPAQTRDGRMRLDGEGRLVNTNGQAYLDDGGKPILAPPDAKDVVIGKDGTISADGAQIGRLAIVRFDGPQALIKNGDGLFVAPAGVQPIPDEKTRVGQGRVEQSNVRGIVEMTRMMDLSRDYQAVSKMVEDGQELVRSAINRLGKSS